jgi:hypothetical protein
MTRFWRNGFYRISANGITHWVEGHWVERDLWYSWIPSPSAQVDAPKQISAGKSLTSAYVNPNARCPVCNAAVYFYQNQYGARVFFDELGPPWPKHPCTDSLHYKNAMADATLLERINPDGVIWTTIESALTKQKQVFSEKYGRQPAKMFYVRRKFQSGRSTLLAVVPVVGSKDAIKLLLARRAPESLGKGSIIFVDDRRVSYFDQNEMQVTTLRFRLVSQRATI